jgi:hypothetical protein
VSKEQDLDGKRQAGVQDDDDNEEHLAGLAVGGAQHRVEVAEQEGDGQAEADNDEDPVEDGDGGPADEGDGDPDEVGVAIQSPAFEEVGGLAAEVAESEEEGDGDDERVSVDETGGA